MTSDSDEAKESPADPQPTDQDPENDPPPSSNDPAAELFDRWGLRPGRTAYGWTVDHVALDRFRLSAYVEFARNDDRIRIRFRRIGAEPSFAQVGSIDMYYDQIEDTAVKEEAGEVIRLLVEWFHQRGDHQALDELLASLESGDASVDSDGDS